MRSGDVFGATRCSRISTVIRQDDSFDQIRRGSILCGEVTEAGAKLTLCDGSFSLDHLRASAIGHD
jgi:hypothetical protein